MLKLNLAYIIVVTNLKINYNINFVGSSKLSTDVLAAITSGAAGAICILCIFIIGITTYCYHHRRKSPNAHVTLRTAVTTTPLNTNISEIDNSPYQASVPTKLKLNEWGTELPPSYASILQQYPKDVYTTLGKVQFEMQQRPGYYTNHYPNPPPPHSVTYYPNQVTVFDANNSQPSEYEHVGDCNKRYPPKQDY